MLQPYFFCDALFVYSTYGSKVDLVNPSYHGRLDSTHPFVFGLRSLQYWSEGSQILVQFVFYCNNVSSECSGPERCSRKKFECDFWGRGQNTKVQIEKKNLKHILNNVKWNYKAWATATFSISAPITEIWTF